MKYVQKAPHKGYWKLKNLKKSESNGIRHIYQNIKPRGIYFNEIKHKAKCFAEGSLLEEFFIKYGCR